MESWSAISWRDYRAGLIGVNVATFRLLRDAPELGGARAAS